MSTFDTRCIAREDPDYPEGMKSLPGSLRRSPLYLRGELPAQPGIAIVGTRHPTVKARDMAHALAEAAVAEGFAVWSGGAKGIDGAAHEGALAAGGRTVMVTTGCFDDPYPPEHAGLYRLVLDGGGALLSLEPPGARRFTFHFPRRNYVLVALTLATLVAQARETGGAPACARVVRKLRRPLWIVPQAPWSAAGRGSALELAKGGAVAIATIDDLRAQLAALAARWRAGSQLELFAVDPKVELARRARAQLEPEEASVLAALGAEPTHPDGICDAIGLGYGVVSRSLLALSLDGLVLEGPSGYFRRAPYVDAGSTP